MSRDLPKIPNVPVAVAAAILRSTPAQINEAISKKLYPCAPSTVAGSRRIFRENDILGLRIFEHLIGTGMTHAVAGRVACDAVQWADGNTPEGLELVEVRFPNHASYWNGLGIYRTANGNLVTCHNETPPTDRELGVRSSLNVLVDLHLEDIRSVFQQKLDDGTITPVKGRFAGYIAVGGDE